MTSNSVLILKGFTSFNNLIACFMNQITKILAVAGSVLPIITSSCKKDTLPDIRSILCHPTIPTQLVKDFGGSTGSTIGPGGDLFVPSNKAGTILRVDPKTGNYTTFASGLPKLIPAVGPDIGGVTDVAFFSGKAYALVSLV